MIRISLFVFLFVFSSTSVWAALSIPDSFKIGAQSSPPPPSWNFTVAREAARTAGVAPLSVFFSAGLTESSTTGRDFHDYEYSWNFGDSAGDTWETTGTSKNVAKGPVTAHVYESSGSYTATLTVKNSSSGAVVDSETFSITVQDPDVIFSGTNTTCVSDTKNNNFTGCPTGANQVSTDTLSTVTGYAGAGERLLFHRGSSWSSSAALSFPNNTGPVSIGAYGTCTSPDARGICSNAPAVSMTNGDKFIDFSQKRDWRVSDLSISGGVGSSGCIGGITDYRQITLSRLKITGFNQGMLFEHWKSDAADLIDQITLYDNDIRGTNSNNVYIGAERIAVLGNKFADSYTTHVLRVWQSYMGVINYNNISGASTTNSNGRHAIKLHSPIESTVSASGTGIALNHRTEYTILAGNIFGSSGYWPVAISPQNAQEDERLSDIIFEKNRIIPDYGTSSATLVNTALHISARYMTVRNNIIEGTGAGPGIIGIVIEQRGVEPAPLGVEVYNNTIYSSSSHANGATGVSISSNSTETTIKNNLVSFPKTSNTTLISDASSDLVQSNNTMTDTPGLVDSDNVNPLSRNFSLSATSIALDAGTGVPVLDDFNVMNRNLTAPDLGAVEY